jgi:ABC-type transporter Mla subunit MlaD
MNPLTQIPAQTRMYIYMTYFAVGVLFGAIQVGAAAIPDAGQPNWLTAALVVYAYLGTALGLTAASNVTSSDVPAPAPDNNPLNPEA